MQSIKDDDLAGLMGLALKELGKVMAVLENDKLIRVYVYQFTDCNSRASQPAATAKTS